MQRNHDMPAVTDPVVTDGPPDGMLLRPGARARLALAAVIALLIFCADILSPLQGAIAVLYITVILLVAGSGGRRSVLWTGLLCAVLTTIAFVEMYRGELGESVTFTLDEAEALGLALGQAVQQARD